MLRELANELRRQGEVHVLGDVVEHHRQWALVGHGTIVRPKRLDVHRVRVVVRSDDEHRIGAGGFRIGATLQCLARGLRAGTHEQHAVARRCATRRFEQYAPLIIGEERRFAGRAAHDDAVQSGANERVDVSCERGHVEVFRLLVERCDDGSEYALESDCHGR